MSKFNSLIEGKCMLAISWTKFMMFSSESRGLSAGAAKEKFCRREGVSADELGEAIDVAHRYLKHH